MSGQAGDVAELITQLAELRDLIREAHAATKDLRAAIREARSETRGVADACARAAYEAANDEMARWAAHVQREMNTRARELNRAVEAARDHIGRALMPKIAEVLVAEDGTAGGVFLEFTGSLFDADVPVPEAPPVPPGLRRGRGRVR